MDYIMNNKHEKFTQNHKGKEQNLPTKDINSLKKIDPTIERYEDSQLRILKNIYLSLKSSTVWEFIDEIKPGKVGDRLIEIIIEFSKYFVINISMKKDTGEYFFVYTFSTRNLDDKPDEIIDQKGGFMSISQLLIRIVLIISRFSRFYKFSSEKIKQLIRNITGKRKGFNLKEVKEDS
jgi:hypothetical protein